MKVKCPLRKKKSGTKRKKLTFHIFWFYNGVLYFKELFCHSGERTLLFSGLYTSGGQNVCLVGGA